MYELLQILVFNGFDKASLLADFHSDIEALKTDLRTTEYDVYRGGYPVDEGRSQIDSWSDSRGDYWGAQASTGVFAGMGAEQRNSHGMCAVDMIDDNQLHALILALEVTA